ncbi:hypothetical protein [Aliiroseovarius crassostreae]|uniref:hypothetical protein n=1 Tax=Aliiroseovarius crassostreae TaxID=154981 RepID=UPI003C7DDAED
MLGMKMKSGDLSLPALIGPAIFLSLGLLAAQPSYAQSVSDCDWRAASINLVEPWDETSRTFANGDVRIALLDTVEPAAAAYHLLILSPPYDEVGGRQCRVISAEDTLGFMGVTFDQIEAEYDPEHGLVFRLPVARYNADTSEGDWLDLLFVVNQASGQVVADVVEPAQ